MATPLLVHAIGNKIATVLAGGINNSDLSISVSSGVGLNTDGGYIIIDKGLANEEIVYIESVTGTTLIISNDGRGRCGTSAVSHSSGATVSDVIVDEHIEGMQTVFLLEHNDDGTHKAAPLIDLIYPIGSIYTSVVSTNPGTLLGHGTWAAFGAGRVLVGIDAAQTEFDTVEETGGVKTVTLTINEMPSHTHIQNAHTHSTFGQSPQYADDSGYPVHIQNPAAASVPTTTTGSTTATNQNTGGGGAHNNLQPYIVVYMWKRTA